MNEMDASGTGWKIEANHVFPVNDLREHVPGNCWCHPNENEGIFVHNSLDRRELFERGERKLS